MHPIPLTERLASLAAAAVLCGCASTPAPEHALDMRQGSNRELVKTRDAWADCIRTAIPRVDDPAASTGAVAAAAMGACAAQYQEMEQAVARNVAPSCGERAACARNALAKAQREATQVATDEVVTERVRVAGARVLECQ